MFKKIVVLFAVLSAAVQLTAFAENPQVEQAPVIKPGCEAIEDEFIWVEPGVTEMVIRKYSIRASEWFDNANGAKYYCISDDETNAAYINISTGEFIYFPDITDVGRTKIFYIYAENDFGDSDDIKFSLIVNQDLNAPAPEFKMKYRIFHKTDNSSIITNLREQAYDKFGIACDLKLNGNVITDVLVDGISSDYCLISNIYHPYSKVNIFGFTMDMCKNFEEGSHDVQIVFGNGKYIEFSFYIDEDVEEYQVTYAASYPDNEFIVTMAQESVKKGDTIKLPKLKDTKKYKFMGWWSNTDNPEDSIEYTSDTPIMSNVSLKARWEDRLYKVVFMSDGKEFSGAEYKYGDIAALPENPLKSGYIFNGWYTEENGKGDKLSAPVTVQSDIAGYAYFTKKTSSGHRTSSISIKAPVQVISENKNSPIKYFKRKKFIYGYPDGTFKPDEYLTRAEAAAVLFRLGDTENIADAHTFDDVTQDSWYYDEVAFIGKRAELENKIFKPEDKITRIDFCIWICKVLNIEPENTENIFADLQNVYGSEYVNVLHDNNIIMGYEDNIFRPYSYVTRAEAVTVISGRLMDKAGLNQHQTKYTDVSSEHWAYKYIMEAGNIQD